MSKQCKFCEIVSGHSPASVVYEDEKAMCFMTLRPTRDGECLIIPKEHIDHFTDIPDEIASHIMVIAQKVGRNMRKHFGGKRVGMVVHGFGVAHAHLILLPQHDTNDITSGRFSKIENGKIIFDNNHLPILDRKTLDEHAKKLRIDNLN